MRGYIELIGLRCSFLSLLEREMRRELQASTAVKMISRIAVRIWPLGELEENQQPASSSRSQQGLGSLAA